ncbi:MAG: hypothetical protein MAG581_01600 [Deltaproteobacteria bacterium]|nr:hypothetical protein [Deltaproteobacteria bacterium]
MNPDTQKDSATSKFQEDPADEEQSFPFKQAQFFRNLLLGVSIVLIVGSAIFTLDLLPSIMLGCLVIGFNYVCTTQFVRKLLKEGKLLPLDLLFYLSKFVISVVFMFAAMNYLNLSAGGLLIGLSNIALATIIYSFMRVMRSQ